MTIWTGEFIAIVVTGVFSLIGSTAVIVWFIASQFSDNRNLMYELVKDLRDTFVEKLEYHEKHDDERFAQLGRDYNEGLKQVSDRVWNVELRNAAKDGILPVEYPVHRKQSK